VFPTNKRRQRHGYTNLENAEVYQKTNVEENAKVTQDAPETPDAF